MSRNKEISNTFHKFSMTEATSSTLGDTHPAPFASLVPEKKIYYIRQRTVDIIGIGTDTTCNLNKPSPR